MSIHGGSDQQSRFTYLRAASDVGASIAMMIAAIVLVTGTYPGAPLQRRGSTTPTPSSPLSTAGAPILGNDDARVVLMEFSDFECPFCAKFATQVLPGLRAKYLDTGVAKLVFRYFPLPSHPDSLPWATAAACADQQHRFWPIHDSLFASATTSNSLSDKQAAIAGLDALAFRACRDAGPAPAVLRDLQLAKTLHVASTPTFFIGTQTKHGEVSVQTVLAGAQPLEQFSKVLDAIWSKTRH